MQLNFQQAAQGEGKEHPATGNYYCIPWRAVITPLKSGLSCCVPSNGIKCAHCGSTTFNYTAHTLARE